MQTFLPYQDYEKSARCLDPVRLLNQRNEAEIICQHIFPRRANCSICFDDGAIPTCQSCGVSYCSVCRSRGGIPVCVKCGRAYKGGPTQGWKNHPAVKMWTKARWALLSYTYEICFECTRRGYADSVQAKLKNYGKYVPLSKMMSRHWLPRWFYDESIYASHRSALLRKDPIWYKQFDWKESNDLPYVWPNP